MKKILLLITLICCCFVNVSIAANPEDILTEVIDGIHRIPLTDGRSLFGDDLRPGSSCFQLENLDNTGGAWASHQGGVFRRMLNKRIKEKGRWLWSKDVYYTTEEFLTAYRDLAERACRLNPDALNFFRTLLLHGNVYKTPLPGLKESPDRITRGKWFDMVFELRFRRKADATSEALITIRDELARRAPTATAPRDDAPTLRHRRHSPADADTVVLHEASGDETDHSTESDPLLGHKEE